MSLALQPICYLDAPGLGRELPPGFEACELPPAEKPAAWARWLDQTRVKRIVYRPRFLLRLDDLELVSFLPGGASFGFWCWCDLHVRVKEPAQLLAELGAEQEDGQWAVPHDALAGWFREPLVQSIEALGGRGDLTSEAYWPMVAEGVAQRLACPTGVALDLSREQPACVLRKVRSFEQYNEELRRRQEFWVDYEQLQRDGAVVRAFQAAERGDAKAVEQLLKSMGEHKVADLLTPDERQRSAGDRLSSYIEILAPSSAHAPHPGVVIGRYKLLTQLGQGGQGQVWKAWETTGERFVVLKLVPPELQHATEEIDRLRTTFKIIQGLQHSSICPVILLEPDSRFGWYQVMKYIDGQTLSTYRSTYAAKYGAFPLEQVIKVLRPVAEALDYAHRQKVIHRDIKPGNIVVAGEATDVQVVDFGLAAEIRTSMSRVSRQRMETSGTRPYMAPEQWRGEEQDARTDQYALAVVAYELLAGHLPFDSPDFDILRSCVLSETSKPIADQPESVNRALQVGLAKRREERFASCSEFVQSLEGKTSQVGAASPVVRHAAGAPVRSVRSSRKTIRKLLAGLAALALLAAFLSPPGLRILDGMRWDSTTRESPPSSTLDGVAQDEPRSHVSPRQQSLPSPILNGTAKNEQRTQVSPKQQSLPRDRGRVTGQVTFDGQPLVEGSITFTPKAGGQPSSSPIDVKGTYELKHANSEKGAEIGEHAVEISNATLGLVHRTAFVNSNENVLDFELSSDEVLGALSDRRTSNRLVRLTPDRNVRKPQIGQPFIVDGTQPDGSPFDWTKYRGKVVLVVFWATWCQPCLEELPNIEKNYEAYHDQGFEVIGINMDDEAETVESFLIHRPSAWTTVFVAGAYGDIDAIPFIVLLDRNGKVSAVDVRGERLQQTLTQMLRPARTTAAPGMSEKNR
jgi:serine/threonine protein kinase/thiol-disulfide isomerase/thioredoxin